MPSHPLTRRPILSAALLTIGSLLSPTPTVSAVGRPAMFGVTIDGIHPLPQIAEALRRLARPPTTRIVFDEFEPASNYETAVKTIRSIGPVMGELLDSSAMKQYSLQAYTQRADEYLSRLGPYVSIWEIGNEVNGEWTGVPQEVARKVDAAFDQAKAYQAVSAISLVYNEYCWEARPNEIFTWIQHHLPPKIRSGLDYVFVNYYETDCEGPAPDWPQVFARLGTIFPHAQMGIGECGTQEEGDKAALIRKYYSMQIHHPRFIGGYFWWYFRQDMVPYTKKHWTVLNQAALRP